MPRVYKLIDGGTVEAPDNPTKEQLRWLNDNVDWKADTAKSVGSNLVESVLRAPLIGGDLMKLGAIGINKLRPGTISDENVNRFGSDKLMEILKSENVFSPYQPATAPGRYAGTAANFVGGAVATGGLAGVKNVTLGAKAAPEIVEGLKRGILSASKAPALVTAGGAGTVAELAGDASRKFDPGEQQNPLVKAAAGMGAAVVGATARGMTASPHRQVISDTSHELTPAAIAEARKNAEQMTRLGVRSHTVGDVLPEGNSISALQRDVSNSTGGSLLQQKMGPMRSGETGDINSLLIGAKNEIFPVPPNAQEVTHAAAQQGKNYIQDLGRTNQTAQTLALRAGPQPALGDVEALAEALARRSLTPQNIGTNEQKAFAHAAQVINPGGGIRVPGFSMGPVPGMPPPMPSAPPFQAPGPMAMNPGAQLPNASGPLAPRGMVPEISPQMPRVPPPQGTPVFFDLENLNKRVASLLGFSTPAGNAASVDMQRAVRAAGQAADEGVRSFSPPYTAARNNYDAFNRNIVQPNERGLIGQTANLVGSESLGPGSLPNVLKRFNPPQLQSDVPLIAPTDTAKAQIARLFAEQGGARPIPYKATDAGRAAMGEREQLAAILSTMDQQPGGVMPRLQASDRLSQLMPEAGMDSSVKQNLGQNTWSTLLSPFTETARRLRLQTSAAETQKLAELLGNPTPANLKILQELAAQDPLLARQLANKGMLGGVGTVTSSTPVAPLE